METNERTACSLSSNHIFNPLFITPNVKKSEKIEFELYASDQHGVVASDSVTIVVIPGSSKEGQVSNKDGQNTRPTKVESDDASTRIDQPPPLSSEQLMVSSSSSDATSPTVVSTKPLTVLQELQFPQPLRPHLVKKYRALLSIPPHSH